MKDNLDYDAVFGVLLTIVVVLMLFGIILYSVFELIISLIK